MKEESGSEESDENDEIDSEDEIPEEEIDALLQDTIASLKFKANPRIFRHSALKNFLSHTITSLNPDLSLGSNTIDYYSEVFSRYIFDSACYEFWKIKNNHSDFKGWPEPLKMDHFVECAWKGQSESELHAVHRV